MSNLHSSIFLAEWDTLATLLHASSPSVLLDGRSLQLPHVVAAARYCAPVDLEPGCHAQLGASVDSLNSRIKNGEIIYGVNTGFGGSADARNKQTQELQRVLIRELHYGLLSPGPRDPHSRHNTDSPFRFESSEEQTPEAINLPKTWTRAAILIRANTLVKGYSAIRPATVDAMLSLLSNDIIPVIPLRGSISASGDLSPLSYIGGAIQGKSTIRIHSPCGTLYADTAFAKAGLNPITLGAKEGLAIVNGTAISCAAAALTLHDTQLLAILSQIITAMSVEALCGTEESFDSFFSDCRPHLGQIDATNNIRSFLRGSKLIQVNDGSANKLRQDRYSIRTAPQWIGPSLEDLVLANQQITTELNSATDNPLINSSGQILHGGNFQAKSVTSAMEKARQAVQSIGRMQFSQCVEIINPTTSFGLPPNLVAEDPGTSYIFKGTDICIAALQAELGFLSNPMNHVQTAELGNQSLNSLALISARYTHLSNDILCQINATHLLALCQALDLRAMTAQFFDMFRPNFEAMLEKDYYPVAHLAGNIDENAAKTQLLNALWSELQMSFTATVTLNLGERVAKIAQSLRGVLLTEANILQFLNPLTAAQGFCDSFMTSMHESWVAFRDAYMVHGDASPFLGRASKRIYNFIRRELGVPFLFSGRLRTPTFGEGLVGDDETAGSQQAPTVGTYTSVIYQALRNGRFAEVIMGILAEVKIE